MHFSQWFEGWVNTIKRVSELNTKGSPKYSLSEYYVIIKKFQILSEENQMIIPVNHTQTSY